MTIGNCLLILLLGTIIYMWIWLVRQNSIVIRLHKGGEKNGSILNETYIEQQKSLIEISASSYIPNSPNPPYVAPSFYVNEIQRQTYNYVGLALLAFWVLVTHSFAINLVSSNHVANGCYFQLQQMFIAEVIKFGVWSICFLSVFSVNETIFSSETLSWCRHTYLWLKIAIVVAIAPTSFLSLYGMFRFATRNRLQDQVTCGYQWINFSLVSIVCGLNYVALYHFESLTFSAIFLFLVSLTSLFVYDYGGENGCKNFIKIVFAGLLICENVFFLVNPILRLPCSCFEPVVNTDEINCLGYDNIESFINDTNYSISSYSVFAMLFGLICPSFNAISFILLDTNLRRAFLEYCQFPNIFVARNIDGGVDIDEEDGRLLFDRQGNERRARGDDEVSVDYSNPDPDDYHDCAEEPGDLNNDAQDFPNHDYRAYGGGDGMDYHDAQQVAPQNDFPTPIHDSESVYNAPHGLRN